MVFILTLGIAGEELAASAGDALPLLSLQILMGLSGCLIRRCLTTSRGLRGLLGDIGTFGLTFTASFGGMETSLLIKSFESFLAFRASSASRQDDSLEVGGLTLLRDKDVLVSETGCLFFSLMLFW